MRALVLLAVVACGGAKAPVPVSARALDVDDVMMYRDGALVRQRVVVDVGATRVASVKVKVAAGIGAEQVVVVERGALELRGLHAATVKGADADSDAGSGSDSDSDPDPDAGSDSGTGSGSGSGSDSGSGSGSGPGIVLSGTPSELRVDVAAPRAGHYTLVLAYITDRLRWDAAYTMTTTPSRDRAVVRGALAVRNSTGVALHARAEVVDAELGASRGKTAELLAAGLVGGTQSTTPVATPRALGVLDLAEGETRVELLAGTASRAMHSVLVYDPIGTSLDNPSGMPERDPALGTKTHDTRITESFEVARDEAASAGMPAGPVRLLERRADGSLAVLGESRLFDAATRVADADTIAIGTAEGITGRRERRELTVDEDGKRIVEEIAITIDNQRDVAASVLMREHLYRGQNWTLAYSSASAAAKEGPQQIALRAMVPPKTVRKYLYVAVYTW